MKNQTLRTVVAVSLLIALASVCAGAADLVVEAKSSFKAGDRTYSAGRYKISSARAATDRTLTIRSVDTGIESYVKFVTRLSPRDKLKGSVVFDKVGNEHYLSEVYFPGEDGYDLGGARVDHTHVVSPAGSEK